MTDIPLPPCPFCGGKAVGHRLPNLDELDISHDPMCFIAEIDGLMDFHDEPGVIPAESRLFTGWQRRDPPRMA